MWNRGLDPLAGPYFYRYGKIFLFKEITYHGSVNANSAIKQIMNCGAHDHWSIADLMQVQHMRQQTNFNIATFYNWNILNGLFHYCMFTPSSIQPTYK